VAPQASVLAEATVLAEASVATEAPVAAEPAGVRLHDPEGAAQKLLAAAQIAADSLTADADAYGQRVRAEADSYVGDTRSEADEHAATVTSTAEAQAAAIREVAADEARRVAEEARSELVVQIEALSATKVVLERDNAALQTRLDTERGRILAIVDELRASLGDDDHSTHSATPGHALDDIAAEVDAAFTEPEPEPEPEPDTDTEHEPQFEAEPLSALGSVSELQPRPEPEAPELSNVSDISNISDATAQASRSVFDLGDDEAAEDDDTSADWMDASPAPLPDGAPLGEATIFDIEAEPGTSPDPGDRFFDELRQADADSDKLGPADDDTDAALSAFFEPEEEPDTDGRWRDRFGPGRS